MKINDIKIYELKPLCWKYIWKLGVLEIDRKTPVNLLRVSTDDGIEGNLTTCSVRAGTMAEVVDFLRPFVVGMDPFYREEIWQKVYELGQLSVGYGIGPTLGALDIALWDIAGKAAGLPIYKLLGAYRDKIRAYASTLTYPTIKDYLDLCNTLVDKGFTAIKMHPVGVPKVDIKLCHAVREAVGSEVDLMLDGTFAYDHEGALMVGKELDKLGFAWLEDPLPNTDIEGYAKLTEAIETPVKVGEAFGDWARGPTIGLFYEYIRRGAADIIAGVGDRIGGITAMRKIAALCETAGIRYEPHNFGTTLVQAAHFHIELASKNCEFFELPVPEGIFDEGMKDTFRIDSQGDVHAPKKPGLGMEIDWEEIEKITLKIY